MGEIDTKPIESVQAALSLFGEKGDQKRYRSRTSSSDGESDEGDELQALQKELANYKVQLEAKESAHMQVLLKLQQYEERVGELSTTLVKSELEKDHFLKECRDAGNRADELESKLKEMADQVSETAKVREQLSHVLNELKATQAELLGKDTELAAAREMELKMETSAAMEREKVEELLKHAEELSEAIFLLKAAALETEKEKSSILSKKDAEIERATEAAVQAQEQLEDMKKQAELIEELENQLQAKSVFIESLQIELHEANELLSSFEKAASDAMANVNTLKVVLEVKERNISDRTVDIEVMEMELNQLKAQLSDANENISHLNGNIEMLTSDLEQAKGELAEVNRRENDAQVEIALLKSELHKARSRLAAAEAAEMRASSIKSGLYLAVQQLAVEAGEVKKENQRLRLGADKIEDEAEAEENFSFTVGPQMMIKTSSLDNEAAGNKSNITIPSEECESLIWEAEIVDQTEDSNQHPQSEPKQEVEALKRELEAATAKIGEFRTRTEQAMSRAESAEKAKSALEDQLRRWREQKQRRKAALAALREESAPQKFSPPSTYDKRCPPLGKVLNMKF